MVNDQDSDSSIEFVKAKYKGFDIESAKRESKKLKIKTKKNSSRSNMSNRSNRSPSKNKESPCTPNEALRPNDQLNDSGRYKSSTA